MKPVHSNPFSHLAMILGIIAIFPFLLMVYLTQFATGSPGLILAIQVGLYLTPIVGIMSVLTGVLGVIRTRTHPGAKGEINTIMGLFLGIIAVVLFILTSAAVATPFG